MFNKLAMGVVLGLSVRTAMEFYTRLKEVNDFGRMTYREASEMITQGKGTVAQHERLTQLVIANMHAAADAQQMRAQVIDPNNPEDMQKLQQLLKKNDNSGQSNTGQYL